MGQTLDPTVHPAAPTAARPTIRVVGTAGHVDHGKSTLVRALSGIDPDRLKEEKARGMTIDLGFAWLDLPDPTDPQRSESLGIVDVPGHIDFIKNMLAGVGGIDAALLVIAADEGVMPQTREHLAILDLLAVPAAVVVLTKTDLVELDVAELLQGTHLAGAPIVRVSAATGVGLPLLRQTLAATLARLPGRRNRARPRLPIDRIFSLSGFGTVVTGTLLDGSFTVGDAVEILPAGLPARIRGLQTHKKQVAAGEPGRRLAVNLTGVDTHQLQRGDVVARPGALQPTTLIDVRFRLLADVGRPLRHNQRVDFFSGALEVGAHARILGVEELLPGQEGWLQLRLARPIVVAGGDRYILRQPSPSATLGGGVVVSPQPRRRWRRFDPAVVARLQTLSHGAPDEVILQVLDRQPLATPAQLSAASELERAVAAAAIAELLAAGAVRELATGGEPALLSLDAWTRLAAGLQQLLAVFHAQAPLRRGMARGEVRTRLQALLPNAVLSVKLYNAFLATEQEAGAVEADDAFVWRAGFAPTPTAQQQRAAERLLAEYARQPYAPPNWDETLRLLSDDAELLEMLVAQGRLVRLGSDVLLRGEDFTAMLAGIVRHLQEKGTITLAETRDLFGTSRKYAQAVLEELDGRRITRREGDVRVLR